MNIKFTHHAKFRLEKRRILKEEVIDAIKNSDIILKKHGLYYHQKRLNRGNIEVVCKKKENI